MEQRNIEGHPARDEIVNETSSHYGLGVSNTNLKHISCPHCGNSCVNDEFWSKFDLFAAANHVTIIQGYVCWDMARAEYAKRKRLNGRYRLGGIWERLMRGKSFIIEGPVAKFEGPADEFGLSVKAHEGNTEITLKVVELPS